MPTGASGLPLAGVEAIVEGLSSFQGDIRSMNSALDSIRPRQTLLQSAFETAWGAVKDFGREILNVAEYALGHILADAIEFAIRKIGELISATIDAGSEFQTLELRLNGMNLDALIKSGADFDTAQKESIRLTKDQMGWLQKLAATTPYDNTDISNVYTLARSYGFADDAAKELTQNTVDFASGMGLSKEVLERVIMNLGQMVQRGKITSTEMRDLARGAFLPLNDVLERIATKSGKSVVEVMKEISRPGGGLPAQLFIDAFNEMVREEPRFSGAAERMAKTFKAASDNALDIVKSIGGLNVVKPILDVIGERISAFTGAFTDNPEKWDRMVRAASRLGDALANIVGKVLDLLPSSNTLADMAVAGVEKLAIWIETHQEDIIGFFAGIGDTVRDKIIPWIKEHLVPLFERISDWVKENGPLIKEFFSTVGEMVSRFFSDLTGGQEGKQKGGDVLDAITRFMRFVIDNQDAILKWVEILWSVFVVWQVLSTIWNIAIGIVISLAGFFLTLVTVFATLKIAVGLVVAVFSALLVPMALVVSAIVLGMAYWEMFKRTMVAVKAGIDGLVYGFQVGWAAIKEATIANIAAVEAAIRNKDWVGLGVAIIGGLAKGVLLWMGTLANALLTALVFMVDAARNYLGIHSPSSLFASFGQSLMQGLANGILSGAGAVAGAIEHMGSVAMEKINHWSSVIANALTFGFAGGILNTAPVVTTAVSKVVKDTKKVAERKLRARSPSLVFEELGIFTMQGFAQGIERAAGLAVGAMQNAMSAAMVPAISSLAGAGGSSITNNHTANLTINTSAPVEPIVQDFNMLSSLMGA